MVTASNAKSSGPPRERMEMASIGASGQDTSTVRSEAVSTSPPTFQPIGTTSALRPVAPAHAGQICSPTIHLSGCLRPSAKRTSPSAAMSRTASVPCPAAST